MESNKQSRPEVGKYAKVYKGPEGERLVVVRVGPREKSEMLVRVTGVDSLMDEQIFLCQVKAMGTADKNYVATFNDAPWNFVVVSEGLIRINVQGIAKPIPMSFLELESQAMNAQAFLTEYLTQQGSLK